MMAITAAITPARANPEAGLTIPAPPPAPRVLVGVDVGTDVVTSGSPPVADVETSGAPPVVVAFPAPPVVVAFPATTEDTLEKMAEMEETIWLVGIGTVVVLWVVGVQLVPVTVFVTQTVSSLPSAAMRVARKRARIEVNRILCVIMGICFVKKFVGGGFVKTVKVIYESRTLTLKRQ